MSDTANAASDTAGSHASDTAGSQTAGSHTAASDVVNERPIAGMRIVRTHVGWAAAAGLVPVPLVDLAAITAVQISMVRSLGKLYGLSFRKEAAKSIIGAVVGSGGAVAVSAPVASAMKAVPGVGYFVSTFVEPAAAAASTFALGRVFVHHFDSGGSLLNLDPTVIRKHYYEEFEKARGTSSPAT